MAEKNPVKEQDMKQISNTPEKFRFVGDKAEVVAFKEKTYMFIPNRIYLNVPSELLERMKDKFKEVK